MRRTVRFVRIPFWMTMALALLANGTAEAKSKARPVELVVVTDSLEPLKEHFNSQKHKPRFLALVAPT